jgi:hypothetical protein
MQRFELAPSSVLVIQAADITAVKVEAIVNAANERMLGDRCRKRGNSNL